MASNVTQRARVRRQLILLVAIGIAPVVASYAIYYGWPRAAAVNYGTLHAAPAPPITARRADGSAFTLDDVRGKWAVLMAAGGQCNAACTTSLYAGRQARAIQNADMDRVVRIWLVTDDVAPPPVVLAEHPDVLVVRTTPGVAARLPDAGRALALVDPLGNLVLSWPSNPDIKAMARDLARLLRASSIG